MNQLKGNFQVVIIFLLGFFTAGLMVAGLYFGSTKVQAAQVNVPMNCQKEVLVPYQKMTLVGSADFRVSYNVHECFDTAGYKIKSSQRYTDSKLFVWYTKK